MKLRATATNTLAALLAVIGLVALFASTGSGRAAPIATYEEVVAGIAKGDIVLVDVRETDEFSAGHVPGAINLPLSRLDPKAVPHPEGKKVVVMCRSGNRSGKAAALLSAAGRTDIVDYSGSFSEWSRRGGPVVQGQ